MFEVKKHPKVIIEEKSDFNLELILKPTISKSQTFYEI